MSQANSSTARGTSGGETHTNLAVRQTTVAGEGVSSDVAIPGWQDGCALKSVLAVDFTGGTIEDLTEDFEETATGMISTEDTTGLVLIVLFIHNGLGGSLLRGTY